MGDPVNGCLDFRTGDFSVEAWVKPNVVDGTRDYFLSKFQNGGTWYPGYDLFIDTNGKIGAYVAQSGSGNAIGGT